MSETIHDDIREIDVPGQAGGDAPAEWFCVLVFHPDTRRIGDVAAVPVTGREFRFGRGSPLFGPLFDPLLGPLFDPVSTLSTTGKHSRRNGSAPREAADEGVAVAAAAGIDDPHVSRAAFSLVPAAGQWRLRRSPGRSRLRVAGVEVRDERVLSESQLRAGLVVTLAQRVVVHLRLREFQTPAASRTDAPAETKGPLGRLLGVSAAMQRLRREAERAAAAPDDVLLVGPTGTGKELVAQAIHSLSDRADAPLVAVNMAAMPAEIAPASLFGARRGAYTGADSNRPGYFQQAAGGTLFLDEVGDTPQPLQPLLLRALQERELQVVGGATERVDLRVVSATEQDPDGPDSRLRASLRHRLAAQELRLPALVERAEDIGLLAARRFEELAERGAGPWLAMRADDAELRRWALLFEALASYHWPGNVRELRSVVAQIAHASESRLVVPALQGRRLFPGVEPDRGPADADGGARPGSGSPPEGQVREQAPRRLADLSDEEFRSAWKACGFEVTALARELGVSRAAVYRRLRTTEGCRIAADIPLGELLAVLDECRGDLESSARRLEVSRRGLESRLRASGVRGVGDPETPAPSPDG